ncbi:MAG: prepilin-type N-terminal cleavage/methylation domain-containing protein [Vicinamibacterales bacterium]
MRRRGEPGFTLIELLIVVAIIAIIASIAIPALLRARMSGEEASAIASLRAINSSQNAFASSCASGSFATVLSDLAIPPVIGGVPFISPDLGVGAPSVVKSGYTFDMQRATDATSPVNPSCNGVAAAALASGYYAFADPNITPNGGRFFWTNTLGTIYYDVSGTLSGETLGSTAPGRGSVLQ